MKKLFAATILLLAAGLILTGCFGKAKEQEFSRSGITITLTDEFVELQQKHLIFYLYGPTGTIQIDRKYKFATLDIPTLEDYTNLVLRIATDGDFSNFNKYSDDDTTFYHAEYHRTDLGDPSSHFLVTLEGLEYYYEITFRSKQDTFNKNQKKFMEYAKTIRIENL